MIPATFEYHRPSSLQDAVALLGRLGDDAKVLAGGQSLIPLMKLRLASPRHLVDLNRITGLASIAERDGALVIGALVRESELEASEVVRHRFPILADACRVIADPLVRNLATVGGNLAHGDPANDHPAVMLALDAEVVAVGPHGPRRIPVAEFFTGPLATALDPGEISRRSASRFRPHGPPGPISSSSGRSATSRRRRSASSSPWPAAMRACTPASA
jgi:aerobic carbon-monoxide dehydrogenase medium subunit